jgi:hypothetical protein
VATAHHQTPAARLQRQLAALDLKKWQNATNIAVAIV